jgi:hypothetical protein
MAPKNNAKGGDKKGAAGKGKGKDAGNDDKSKVKGAQSINVRHILVSSIPHSLSISIFPVWGVPVASSFLGYPHPPGERLTMTASIHSVRNTPRKKKPLRNFATEPSLTRWLASSPKIKRGKVCDLLCMNPAHRISLFLSESSSDDLRGR